MYVLTDCNVVTFLTVAGIKIAIFKLACIYLTFMSHSFADLIAKFKALQSYDSNAILILKYFHTTCKVGLTILDGLKINKRL